MQKNPSKYGSVNNCLAGRVLKRTMWAKAIMHWLLKCHIIHSQGGLRTDFYTEMLKSFDDESPVALVFGVS